MNSLSKAAWRARLRGRRAGDGDASRQWAEQGLARVGLDWLAELSAAGLLPAGLSAAGEAPAKEADDGGPAVCAYASMGSEPATGALLAALHASGYAVHVPVCEPGFQLAWVHWFPGVDMARSRFAPVMEPVGERRSFTQLGPVLAVFVPALAVDGSGTRMGQGGGYYDRFLAGLAAPPGGPNASVPVAAVVHDHEVLKAGELPRDTYDLPVGFALTPGGLQRLGTPRTH